jgi:hypothetical protein
LKKEIQDKQTGEDQGLRVEVAKPKRVTFGKKKKWHYTTGDLSKEVQFLRNYL